MYSRACCHNRRPRNHRGVPRDVTRTDVIADEDDEDERDDVRSGVSASATWRLSELWIDESDVYHVDQFMDRRPATAAAADDDDDDDDSCVEQHPRRSRPDLVPRQSPFVTSLPARRDQELNKTCDDVMVLHRLTSPVYCRCVPVGESEVIT